MRFVKSLALLVAAIFVARVLVTALGMLLSVTPMIFELPDSEMARRTTYEILVAYFFAVAALLVATSVSLFNQATKRNAFQLKFVLTAIALTICGAHLLLAIVGNPEKSLLVQFAQNFVWVPALTGFATLTSFFISRSQRFP